MSYDLRRLRLHGLIARVPRTNTYVVTPEGIRVAVFYTKLRDRLLGPLLEADKLPAPLELRRALHTVDHAVGSPWLPWRLRTLDSFLASGVVLCSVSPLEVVGSGLQESRESGSPCALKGM